MRIPEHKIEEVRASADIVDVVSGFVKLKKAGRFFTGLCPFHQEKTPSFNVNPERSIYKCFGCGRGGNVFTFLMELEHVSFVDAVLELAERYHITIQPESGGAKQDTADTDVLYEAARVAARFFYDTLQGPQGIAGAEYFKKRGWTQETLKRFGLGYAPDSWDALLRHAKGAGITEEALERTGLVVRREGGHVYDRFRGRVVFPIFSAGKKVIGFGARAMAAGEEPKYLNSPETPIYFKSRVLYGLSHAVRAIRTEESVVIVEGYADVLSLSQAGIGNVVATSGTALTPEQVRMLTRYTRNFFFLYDADSAGFAAMERGIDLMLEQDCDPRIVTLPAGEDPDSYVRKFGADGVREKMRDAVSFVDFVTGRYERQGALQTPEGKTAAVRHVVGLLAKMEDRIRRELYVHHLADKYRIYESVLYDELDTLLKRRRRQPRPPAERASQGLASAGEAPVVSVEIPGAERTFIGQLLQAVPDVQRMALTCAHLDLFIDPRSRALMQHLFEQQEVEGEVSLQDMHTRFGDDAMLQQTLADILLDRLVIPETSDGWLDKQTVRKIDYASSLLQSHQRLLIAQIDRELERLWQMYRLASDDVHLAARISQLNVSRTLVIRSTTSFDELAQIQSELFDDWNDESGHPAEHDTVAN